MPFTLESEMSIHLKSSENVVFNNSTKTRIEIFGL